MPEGLNKQLKKEWEEKLKEHGFGNIKNKKELILPVFGKSILAELAPEAELESLINKFTVLFEETQNGILSDIVKQREAGVPPRKILDRLNFLILKSKELENMTSADSDEGYNPKPKKEDLEKLERDEAISRVVNKFIDRAERKSAEDGPDEPGGPRNIN